MRIRLTLLFSALLLSLSASLRAQVPGDTIVVSTFNYTQTQSSRDTFVQFPNLPGVTYEKIYMLYNMRCKNGLVSPPVQGQTNLGCGEWDYTCNTYIVDSTKVDSTKAKHPSHIITGFSGSTYNYRTQPTYTYYQYTQQNVVYNSTVSETSATVGSGLSNASAPLTTDKRSAKSQFLWTAAELSAAGLTAGNITSIRLNLASAGSAAGFLKVRMKHSTQTALNASSPDLGGFTEVYFLNTSLNAGVNQLNFYTPFNWNGTDNLLVEFSFSNAGNGTASSVLSDLTAGISGLVSEGNDFAFEFSGSNRMNLGNGNFTGFSNQISIAFWAYGNPDFLPQNTSAVYATNAQNHRQVNIHFPWSNSRIYWDCGSGGGYDRIDKAANNNEFEGQWNHYVFTKNSATGVMNIYLNGVLWHTGTGLTIPVQITDFMLGTAPNGSNPWFGRMDEFSLWKTELQAADIQAWMHKTITASHPAYADLVAYYRFNEGTGTTSADQSTAAATGTAVGIPVWRLIAGKDVFKNFTETSTRPQITFVQGVYNQTVTPIVTMDSVQNIPNTVYSFIVNNNNIQPFDTNVYYQAGYTYVYDGDLGTLLDSVNNAQSGSISVVQLDYFLRSPAAFQIMSFVTPYGINLDLGMEGKTWTFDVTDYAPILKGWKRMFINGGGERQEDMDIKFVFIVGTPPRDVKDINNLWKVEAPGYTAILNDDKYEPRTVPLAANASAFKIRTAITGHGQEGEFIPRTHFINIAGGNPEFSWDVWKKCAENPVYPQGGTWIYDRAGWCPGMATDTKEMDITPFVTPGSTAMIDYGLNTASGSSNYWVSNQLVNYGAPNFTLDAAVIDVKHPSTKVEYARTNPMCSQPIVVIRNTGSTALTTLRIEYWVNNNPVREVYNWSGSLGFLETAEVSLPFSDNLWSAVNGANGNTFNVEIKDPNGGTDAYSFNNIFRSKFNITNVVPSNFIIWSRMNGAPTETSYEIIDQNGTQIFQRSGMAANTQYRDTFNLPFGCYQFKITDTDEDGIDFWANNDGVGFVRFRAGNGAALVNFEGDFGASFIYNFTIDWPLSYEQLQESSELVLYPNPAQQSFNLEGKAMTNARIRLYNAVGQELQVPVSPSAQGVRVDCSSLPTGIYQVVIQTENGKVLSRKWVKE